MTDDEARDLDLTDDINFARGLRWLHKNAGEYQQHLDTSAMDLGWVSEELLQQHLERLAPGANVNCSATATLRRWYHGRLFQFEREALACAIADVLEAKAKAEKL